MHTLSENEKLYRIPCKREKRKRYPASRTERYGTLRNATERYGTLDETRNVELYIYQTRLIARSVDRKKNCNTFKGIYYIYIYIYYNELNTKELN